MKLTRGLLALFLCLFAGAENLPPAAAQTVSPNPAPTIITSAPYTISAPGFYQLGANLSYAGNGSQNDAIITVNANNVTLDLGGHFLTGTSTNTATQLLGVYANERSNLTLQNGTISYCYIGVALEGTFSATSNNVNHRFRNLLVTHCYSGGIELLGASDSTMERCRVSYIGGPPNTSAVGLECNEGSGNRIDHCTVTNITGNGPQYAAFGILGTDYNVVVTRCFVSNVAVINTPSGGTPAYGIYGPLFAEDNLISNAPAGLYSVSRYKDMLTIDCPDPFASGFAVGDNN